MGIQAPVPAQQLMMPLPQDVAPVAVTPWTARLVDAQCERDYLLSRFAEDRRRFQFLLVFIVLTSSLNLAGDAYAMHSGADLAWGWIPQLVLLAAAALSFPLILRVRSPRALECYAAAFAVVGIAASLALLTLHSRLGAIWPVLMLGALVVIYLCLPVRFTTMVALAFGYTLAVPLVWAIWVGPSPGAEDVYRVALRLVLANVLGFSVANTLQRSQRVQFAQNRLLQQLLSTDSLTGISNRRHFDYALADEWRRCARAGTPLSLLMIDVDHFKAYNDRLGHMQGDDCLRRVAALLTGASRRAGDLVARYGGEEFVCLLPNAGRQGAALVAERLRQDVERACILHPASPLGYLTVSIGVATAMPPAGTPAALVDLADRLLYVAKTQGRNRVAAGQVGERPAFSGADETQPDFMPRAAV